MRRANKMGARWVIFVGKDEVERGVLKIKDMESGEEAVLVDIPIL